MEHFSAQILNFKQLKCNPTKGQHYVYNQAQHYVYNQAHSTLLLSLNLNSLTWNKLSHSVPQPHVTGSETTGGAVSSAELEVQGLGCLCAQLLNRSECAKSKRPVLSIPFPLPSFLETNFLEL